MKQITMLLSIILAGFIATDVIAQSCRDSVIVTTPDSRFSIHNDGTVTDNNTGLIWMRCSLGQIWDTNTSSCTGSISAYSWENSLAAAQSYSFADRSDWRLPNVKELTSIVEESCYDPAINISMFPNTEASFYWSATPYGYTLYNKSWNVNFDGGYNKSNSKDYDAHVRLVRGGQ